MREPGCSSKDEGMGVGRRQSRGLAETGDRPWKPDVILSAVGSGQSVRGGGRSVHGSRSVPGPPVAKRRIRRLWPVTVIAVTTLVTTACHYTDLQCFSPDLGLGARRTHGTLFDLQLDVPYRNGTKSLSLTIDGAGGVEYLEYVASMSSFTACRRMTEEEDDGLARLWPGESTRKQPPQCGAGYDYRPLDATFACRGNARYWHDRRARRLPGVDMVYRAAEGPVRFLWDLESPLPAELDGAFSETLGLLCSESRRLARNLRQSLPELAARAGCAEDAP